MSINKITKNGQTFAINSVGSFESSRGTIAPRDNMLRLPKEGEVFYLTSDIDTGFGGYAANKIGYVENGKIKYFDAEEGLRDFRNEAYKYTENTFFSNNENKIKTQLGSNGGIFSVQPGNVYGTASFKTADGKDATITATRMPNSGGNGMTKYTIKIPGIDAVETTTKESLFRDRPLLTKLSAAALGHPDIDMAYNQSSRNYLTPSNIENFTKDIPAFEKGKLNTYSKQQLESFLGKATEINNPTEINQRYQKYSADGLPAKPTFFKTDTKLTGKGANTYQDLAEIESKKVNVSQGLADTTNAKYGDALVSEGQRISPDDPNYDVYAKQLGVAKPKRDVQNQSTKDFSEMTRQQIADKGYQMVGSRVYSNGQVIGTFDPDYTASETKSSTTTSTNNTTTAKTSTSVASKQATLYGPNGKKEVVDVGSARASKLQSQGWGLTAGSYKNPNTTTGTTSANTTTGLTNQNIANANPDVAANAGFINALYQEAYSRDATQAELDKFIGQNVKDVSNIILGATKSPFSSTSAKTTSGTQENTSATDTPAAEPTKKIQTSRQDIINNFYKYLGRGPNDAEIAKYLYQPPTSLEDALKLQYKRITGNDYTTPGSTSNGANAGTTDNNTSNKNAIIYNGQIISPDDPNYDVYVRQKAQEEAAVKEANDKAAADAKTAESDKSIADKAILDNLNAEIDAMDLSIDQKAVLKEIAKGDYTSGQKIPSGDELAQIISDAAENAKTDLTPYYTEQTRRGLEDFQRGISDIQNEASRFAASEANSYKDTLAKAKQSLRARGLTFSGQSRAELGADTAIASGAKGVEGSLPTSRRLDYQDRIAEYKKSGRDLGIAAERELGTSGIGDIGTIADPYKNGTTYDPSSLSKLYEKKQPGDTGYVNTGDIDLEKLAEIEKSKWDRISKYRSNI